MKSAWLAAAIAIATNSSNLNLARNPGTSVAICNVNSHVPKAKSSYHFFGFNHRWLDVFFAIDCHVFGAESEVLFLFEYVILPAKFPWPQHRPSIPPKKGWISKDFRLQSAHMIFFSSTPSNFSLFQSNHNLGVTHHKVVLLQSL